LAALFCALPFLISEEVASELHFSVAIVATKDQINALLSFGYALLLKDVNALLTVGLEPALGFIISLAQAPPLALDLLEVFRVPLVDMMVMASVNRGQWDVQADFDVRGVQVWLLMLGGASWSLVRTPQGELEAPSNGLFPHLSPTV